MSQRKMRGSPSFGRQDNAPTPIVNNSTLVDNTPNTTANIPNSAPVSSNLEATLPIAPANVANPRSSNLLDAPVEVAKREDFGRDKYFKTLLKHLQPKAFKG